METSPYTLYIVRCADGSLYTGIARDMDRRLAEHNGLSGRGARYTAARRPVVLVYREVHESRSLASKREAEIKKLTRAEKLDLLKRADEKKPATGEPRAESS